VAWGGPVVQIPMIRHELVDEEYQASSERFSPTLALYRAPIQGSWRIDMTLSA